MNSVPILFLFDFCIRDSNATDMSCPFNGNKEKEAEDIGSVSEGRWVAVLFLQAVLTPRDKLSVIHRR